MTERRLRLIQYSIGARNARRRARYAFILDEMAPWQRYLLDQFMKKEDHQSFVLGWAKPVNVEAEAPQCLTPAEADRLADHAAALERQRIVQYMQHAMQHCYDESDRTGLSSLLDEGNALDIAWQAIQNGEHWKVK